MRPEYKYQVAPPLPTQIVEGRSGTCYKRFTVDTSFGDELAKLLAGNHFHFAQKSTQTFAGPIDVYQQSPLGFANDALVPLCQVRKKTHDLIDLRFSR